MSAHSRAQEWKASDTSNPRGTSQSARVCTEVFENNHAGLYQTYGELADLGGGGTCADKTGELLDELLTIAPALARNVCTGTSLL